MGLVAWLDLKPKDIAAFLVAVILGYGGALFVPDGPWSTYAPILISYHLFLLWLVLAQDHKIGLPMSVLYTLATHAACIGVVVSLGMSESHNRYFRFLRVGIAALAAFERSWLFDGRDGAPEPETITAVDPILHASSEDYQEWLAHLATNRSLAAKPAVSLRAEYHRWLYARMYGTASSRPKTSGQ